MVGNVVGFTGAGGRTTRTEAATLITIQGTLSKFCRSVHSCLQLLYKNFHFRLLLCLNIMIIHTAVPRKMHLPAVYTHCPYHVMPTRLGLINGQSSCAISNVYQILCLQILTINVSFKFNSIKAMPR